jgi:hypothetical protein
MTDEVSKGQKTNITKKKTASIEGQGTGSKCSGARSKRQRASNKE